MQKPSLATLSKEQSATELNWKLLIHHQEKHVWEGLLFQCQLIFG